MSQALFSDELLARCWDFIAQKGWAAFSFQSMAEQTAIPLARFQERFSKREDVLAVFFEAVNQKVTQELTQELQTVAEDMPRDFFKEQLLEELMLRFDSFQGYRAFVTRLYQESMTTPCLGAYLLRLLIQSLEKTLQDLHVTPSWNLMGPVLWIYGRGFQAWLDDPSPDLSKTLFALDQQIKKLSPFFE